MQAVLWHDLTPDVVQAMCAEGLDLVLWPIGGLTPPAPHLPFGLGTRLTEELCRAVSATTGTPVLPTLPYGVPGTCAGLAPRILLDCVEGVLSSLGESGFTRVVIVNGVAENLFALETAAQSLRLVQANWSIWVRNLWQVTPAIERVWAGEANVPASAAPAALGHFLFPQSVREPVLETVGVTAAMGAELWDVLVAEWIRFVKRALAERLKAAPEPALAPVPQPVSTCASELALFRPPGGGMG